VTVAETELFATPRSDIPVNSQPGTGRQFGLQIDSRADRRLLQLILTIVGVYIAIAALVLTVIQAVR
jgi:hypothetical protein